MKGPSLEATLSRTSPKYYPTFLQSLRIAQTGLERREEVIWYVIKGRKGQQIGGMKGKTTEERGKKPVRHPISGSHAMGRGHRFDAT